MASCVFAGTFDPFTCGHQFVVDKCVSVFDKVVIAVGVNVDKQPLFSLEQRIDAIKAVYSGNPKIEVLPFSGMLTDFMREHNISVTVRGLRNDVDFKYENTMAQFNLDMLPSIITFYIPTPASLAHVSSSAIRNIIASKGNFSAYVPQNSLPLLQEYLKNK